METFTPPRPMVPSPGFVREREAALGELASAISKGEIDAPLLPLIRAFAQVPACYTIQSCYGHFVHGGQPDTHNIRRLEAGRVPVNRMTYRIAYVTVCIENSRAGHLLRQDLEAVARMDPDYIQFGSADWFWDQTINTYSLQVSPARFRTEDSCTLYIDEALVVQEVRDQFFTELMRVVRRHLPSGW